MYEFRLPPLGEGIETGVVSSLLVKEGDVVEKDQPLLEIESNKAILAIPSPLSGKIVKIFVKEGDQVSIGDVLMEIEKMEKEKEEKKEAPSSLPKTEETPQQTKEHTQVSLEVTEEQTKKKTEIKEEKPFSPSFQRQEPLLVPAGPATRRLARELGVDLTVLWESKGKKGRLTPEDVKHFVRTRAFSPQKRFSPLPDFSSFGPIERKPLSSLRQTIAERMSYSFQNIPHVHQFHEAEVSTLLTLQKKYGELFKAKGSTLSLTVFLIKALALALKKYPQFGTSLDEEKKELIFKKYYHIGVAVDTPQGLLVPVIKNVDQLSIFEIGKKLRELAEKARERRVTPEELSGSCITLSNLGGIGGSFFTPIINPPEVAILGAGRVYTKPVWDGTQWQARPFLPLVLGYDHRVIDGADGARFLTYLVEILEKFDQVLLGLGDDR